MSSEMAPAVQPNQGMAQARPPIAVHSNASTKLTSSAGGTWANDSYCQNA